MYFARVKALQGSLMFSPHFPKHNVGQIDPYGGLT